MRKIIIITTLGVLGLIASACGAAASLPQISSSNSSFGAGSSSSGAPITINSTPTAGPSGLQLAAGMLKLDGTSERHHRPGGFPASAALAILAASADCGHVAGDAGHSAQQFHDAADSRSSRFD